GGRMKNAQKNFLPPEGEVGAKRRVGVNRNAGTKTIGLARNLRHNPTETEKRLWWYLKHSLPQYRFRQQHAIGHYIADFVCLKSKLIIELDGGQHAEQHTHDNKRTA